jgi:hypothetical protein
MVVLPKPFRRWGSIVDSDDTSRLKAARQSRFLPIGLVNVDTVGAADCDLAIGRGAMTRCSKIPVASPVVWRAPRR